MKTTLNTVLLDGVRATVLVTLLALACALMTGCHSRAVAKESAKVEPAGQPVNVNPLVGLTPTPPLDERPITTMETVGASQRD